MAVVITASVRTVVPFSTTRKTEAPEEGPQADRDSRTNSKSFW